MEQQQAADKVERPEESAGKEEEETKASAVQSPPPMSPTRSDDADEPRTRLHQLAELLRNGISRQLLLEYMQLRRALR